MLYTIGEGGPVCSIVIGIGALRRGDVGTVESVLDEQGEVVRREFLEGFPGTSRGEIRGGEGDIWGGGLCVDVVGYACGEVCVVEDGEVGKLKGQGLAPRVCGL